MNVYKITYLDYVEAENEEQAKDILLEQLSMDVRTDDASAFNIEINGGILAKSTMTSQHTYK